LTRINGCSTFILVMLNNSQDNKCNAHYLRGDILALDNCHKDKRISFCLLSNSSQSTNP
jgi:hypothetical protein